MTDRASRRELLAGLASVAGAGCLRLAGDSTATPTTSTSSRATGTATPTESTGDVTATSPTTGGSVPLEGHYPEFGYDGGNTGSVSWPAGPTEEPEVVWVGPKAGPSAPAVDGRDIFVGGGSGSLYALRDGGVRWEAFLGRTDPVWSSPLLVKDLVIVGDHEGYLRAYQRDKTLRWRSPRMYPEDADWTPTVHTDPTYASGTVVCGGSDGKVYALGLGDGQPVWSKSVGGGGLSPAVAGGRVFVGTDATDRPDVDGLRALSLSNGSDLWSFGPDQNFANNPPAVSGGRVYVASRSGTLFALDAADGTELWSHELDGGVHHAAPAVHEGSVYVGDTGGNLTSLNANDGSLGWSRWAFPECQAAPVATANGVYLSSLAGRVVLVDPADGTELWSHTVGELVKTGLAVLEDAIVVASEFNGLHVLR